MHILHLFSFFHFSDICFYIFLSLSSDFFLRSLSNCLFFCLPFLSSFFFVFLSPFSLTLYLFIIITLNIPTSPSFTLPIPLSHLRNQFFLLLFSLLYLPPPPPFPSSHSFSLLPSHSPLFRFPFSPTVFLFPITRYFPLTLFHLPYPLPILPSNIFPSICSYLIPPFFPSSFSPPPLRHLPSTRPSLGAKGRSIGT